MNFTSSPPIQGPVAKLLQHYREVQIASGIFLALVSLAAAVGNGLLLITIWKDPFTNNLLYHWLSGRRFPHRDYCLPDTSIAKHCRIYWNQKKLFDLPISPKSSISGKIHLTNHNEQFIHYFAFAYLESVFSYKLPSQTQRACYQEKS